MRYAAWVVAFGMLIPVAVTAQPKDTTEIKVITAEQAESVRVWWRMDSRAKIMRVDWLSSGESRGWSGDRLSVEQAEALAMFEGQLYLDGLTTLSDKQAETLAKHKDWLSLCGLTTLSDKGANALRSNPKVLLPAKFQR